MCDGITYYYINTINTNAFFMYLPTLLKLWTDFQNYSLTSSWSHPIYVFTYPSWAQASSQRAWVVIPGWTQCGLSTSHTPLNYFAGSAGTHSRWLCSNFVNTPITNLAFLVKSRIYIRKISFW